MNDDTFKDVISEVMEKQVLVFMDAHSTTEERDDAHDIVRAIDSITSYMQTVIDDHKISERTRK